MVELGVRKNIRFQDGSLLKVFDVIYSINRYRDPKILQRKLTVRDLEIRPAGRPNAFDVFTAAADDLLMATATSFSS